MQLSGSRLRPSREHWNLTPLCTDSSFQKGLGPQFIQPQGPIWTQVPHPGVIDDSTNSERTAVSGQS